MNSVYKWRIDLGVYCYIVDETFRPFVYKETTKERIYSLEDVVIMPVTDADILVRVSSMDPTGYATSFNAMITLLINVGYGAKAPKGLPSEYYDVDISACGDIAQSGGLCPKIIVNAQSGDTAGAVITKESKEGATNVYEILFTLPKGATGAKGDKGEQGIPGERGEEGKQGTQGEQGKQGEQGPQGVTPEAQFTSIIFKRSNALVDKVVLAAEWNKLKSEKKSSYTNPLPPSDLGWGDTIPSGNEIVWMSSKVFSTNEDKTGNWSSPTPVNDSETVEYEWCCNTEDMWDKKPKRTSPDDDNPGCSPFNPDEYGWYDTPQPGAIWMAVCHAQGGKYIDEWEVSKIKGENGANGESLHMESEQIAGNDFYHPIYNVNGYKGNKLNEGRICSTDSTYSEVSSQPFIGNHLYIWDGDTWEDMGLFNGETAYVHIKYANSTTGHTTEDSNYIDYLHTWLKWTDEEGQTPNGEYIGIRSSNVEKESEVYKDYKWTYAKGADGFGYEYIYIGTDKEEAPTIPDSGTGFTINGESYPDIKWWAIPEDKNFQQFDFVPVGWEDNLIGVTRSNPYVWEAYRKRDERGVWSQFMGENGKAVLKSVYNDSPEFRSTIFTRSNSLYIEQGQVDNVWAQLCRETDSTYEHPCPISPIGGLMWYDGIPEGKEVLWQSSKIVSKAHLHEKNPTGEWAKYVWTKPVVAEDGKDIDYEWLPGYENKDTSYIRSQRLPLRTSPDDKNPGCSPSNPDANGWYDNPVHDAVWQAACNVIGGEYERVNGAINWKIFRIKGEDGSAGGTNWILDLTNPTDVISLGNDNVLDLKEDKTISVGTTVYLLCGENKEVLSPENVKVIGLEPSDIGKIVINITQNEDNKGVDVTMELHNGLNFDDGYGNLVKKEFTIEVTYNTEKEEEIFRKRYCISGVRGGKDGDVFKLFTNASVVTFDQNLTPSVEKITATAFNSDTQLISPSFNVYYSIGTEIIPVYIDSMKKCSYSETAKTWTCGHDISYNDRGVVLYLVREEDKAIVDYSDIQYNRDGKDGKDVTICDLTNEMNGVGLGNDNLLNSDITFSTGINIINGDKQLSVSSVEVEPDPLFKDYWGGKTSSEGKVSYSVSGSTLLLRFRGSKTNGIDFSVVEGLKITFVLSIKASESSETFTKVIYVVGNKAGDDGKTYQVLPSVNMIKKTFNSDIPSVNPSSVTCKAYISGEEVSATDYIYYSIDDVRSTFSGLNRYTGAISVTTANTSVSFYLVINSHIFDRETIPVISDGKNGESGKEGKKGAAVRGPVLWGSSDITRRFSNGSGPLEEDALFIDVLYRQDTDGIWKYYYCNTSYTGKLNDSWNNVSSKWSLSEQSFDFIATNLLLAKNAKINFLSNNELYLMNGNNQITAGAKGSDSSGEVNFWAGNDGTDLNNAPFRVYNDGKVHASNAEIEGSLSAKMETLDYKKESKMDGNRFQITSTSADGGNFSSISIEILESYSTGKNVPVLCMVCGGERFILSPNSWISETNVNFGQCRSWELSGSSISLTDYSDISKIKDEIEKYTSTYDFGDKIEESFSEFTNIQKKWYEKTSGNTIIYYTRLLEGASAPIDMAAYMEKYYVGIDGEFDMSTSNSGTCITRLEGKESKGLYYVLKTNENGVLRTQRINEYRGTFRWVSYETNGFLTYKQFTVYEFNDGKIKDTLTFKSAFFDYDTEFRPEGRAIAYSTDGINFFSDVS